MTTNIIVLGANGMLGNTLFTYFYNKKEFNTIGILRRKESVIKSKFLFSSPNIYELNSVFDKGLKDKLISFKSDVIINCIGLVKQNPESDNPFSSISINSLLPHYLNNICNQINARFIQISTDCVFSGSKGNYRESDNADANDLYGRSKFLGEVHNHQSVTLRSSYIGEELQTCRGLLSWFLSQKKNVRGFKNAIFSGVTATEFARIIAKFVIPNKKLRGVYHVSSSPIDKYSLLTKLSKIYEKNIEISPDYKLSIDRSLNSSKFKKETGYKPLEWDKSIEIMREFGIKNYE